MRNAATHIAALLLGVGTTVGAYEAFELSQPPTIIEKVEAPAVVKQVKLAAAQPCKGQKQREVSPEEKERRLAMRQEKLREISRERDKKRKEKAEEKRKNMTPEERAEMLLERQAKIEARLEKYLEMAGQGPLDTGRR